MKVTQFLKLCALSTPGACSEEMDDMGDRPRWSWRSMMTRGRRRSCTWQGHQDGRWNCKANIIFFYTDAGAQHSVQEWGWLSKWWTSRRRRCQQDDFFIISYFFSFNVVSILGQIIFHLKFLPLAHVIWKHCAFFFIIRLPQLHFINFIFITSFIIKAKALYWRYKNGFAYK